MSTVPENTQRASYYSYNRTRSLWWLLLSGYSSLKGVLLAHFPISSPSVAFQFLHISLMAPCWLLRVTVLLSSTEDLYLLLLFTRDSTDFPHHTFFPRVTNSFLLNWFSYFLCYDILKDIVLTSLLRKHVRVFKDSE